MRATKDEIAQAIRSTLISPNEADRNSEAANVVDALFAIARAGHDIAAALREQAANEKERTTRM